MGGGGEVERGGSGCGEGIRMCDYYRLRPLCIKRAIQLFFTCSNGRHLERELTFVVTPFIDSTSVDVF